MALKEQVNVVEVYILSCGIQKSEISLKENVLSLFNTNIKC